jgi:hypothetical protein
MDESLKRAIPPLENVYFLSDAMKGTRRREGLDGSNWMDPIGECDIGIWIVQPVEGTDLV